MSLPSLYPSIARRKTLLNLRAPTTNFRVARAELLGYDTSSIADMLAQPSDDSRVRAIVRTQIVCGGTTPLAYYDTWGWL